jgi:hypothetical protein
MSVREVTPAVLLEMGLPPARLQAELFFEYRTWVLNMFAAGEYSVALKAAMEVLQSDRDRAKIAYLRLTVARLFWKQKRLFRSFVAACDAVITKPIIAGDLFWSLLRRVGLS